MLAEAHEGQWLEQVSNLLARRRANNTVVLQTAEKQVAFTARGGGFMGDQDEPEVFMQMFQGAAERWNNRQCI